MERLILTAHHPPVRFELGPGFHTIGRHPTNELPLCDSTISSFHCEISVAEDGVARIHDLGSTNGTFVDGRRIDESPLHVAAALRLGDVELAVERAEAAADHAPIFIPPIPVEQLPNVVLLPDGWPACLYHCTIPAQYQCSRCQSPFCIDCVHELGVSGGERHLFCPACSGICDGLGSPGEAKAGKRPTFLGRLAQTFHFQEGNDK